MNSASAIAVFFLLFGDEGEQTVRLRGKVRLHSGGESLCLVETAADQRRRFDVKLAEVAHRVDVFRIELQRRARRQCGL